MNQMGRTLAVLVVLLAAGLAVGFYAWKGVYEADEKETKQKDVDEHLFMPTTSDERGADGSVASAEFVRVKVTSGPETTVLERDSGKEWKMTSPVQANVDKLVVDGLLTQLQSAKFKYVADENPDAAALAKYGLDKPAFELEADALVGDAKSKRTVRLIAGAENSFNGSIFMRRNDEKQVWGAEGGVKWSFQKSTFDLRDKEVAPIDEAKLTHIDVKTKNNAYALRRDDDKMWTVVPAAPKKGEEVLPADNGAIAGALNGLRSEKAIAFPTQGPEALGFDDPFETLNFTTDGEPMVVKLVKAGGDAGEKIYAWRQNAKGTVLAEVSANALSHFDRRPYDLRDKSVALFKKDAVVKVTFHLPDVGADIVAEKEVVDGGGGAETWRVTAPTQGPAKQFKLASLLWTIASIKGVLVVEETPKDLKKYGLDETAKWVSLSGADGKELTRLTIGKDVPGHLGNKYFKNTKGQVVEADGSRLTDLPHKLDDLLDAPKPATP